MHPALIVLHLGLISAGVVLLLMICSTGNFWRLAGAGVWIGFDLMVAITGVAFCASPAYARLIPRLAAFEFATMGFCLAWMAFDCARRTHPLAPTFFWAFASYAACRVVQLGMYEWRLGSPWLIEAINAVVYLAVVALLISALRLPIRPDVDYVPAPAFTAAPVPGLVATRRMR